LLPFTQINHRLSLNLVGFSSRSLQIVLVAATIQIHERDAAQKRRYIGRVSLGETQAPPCCQPRFSSREAAATNSPNIANVAHRGQF
jgi:hypothetical protein